MNPRATAFAVIATAAQPAHDLADHLTGQTNAQAVGKAAPGYNPGDPADGHGVDYARTWRCNLAHVTAYHATLIGITAATLAVTGVQVRPRRALAAVAVSYGSHAVIDRRWPVERVMKWTGSQDYYPQGAPQVDQALHKFFLWLAALTAATGAH